MNARQPASVEQTVEIRWNPEMADQSDMRVQRRPRSLRAQLVLIPTAMLILGLLGAVGVVLLEAHNRIAAEIASSMELGDDLARSALRNLASVDTPAAAFERLRQDLPRVRHIQFELIPSDGTTGRGAGPRTGETAPPPRSWGARLLAPPPVVQTFPIVVHDKRVGELLLLPDPANEIAEIIGEIELFAGTLVGLDLLIIGGLLWMVRRLLRPVQLLADEFDRLERGDYRPAAPIPIIEFQRIGCQFNRLAQSLQRVTSDNHFLIDQLLSMQDKERKELAADLHDEFGPVLFGIRAEAACIMKLVPNGTELHSRAQSIAGLADGIQKINYRMLDRLRPLVLEQMGLSQALRRQIMSWQATYPHITWSLDMPPSFDDPAEPLSLTLYRAAQESAINAVRHAQASTIEVRLWRQPVCGTGKTTIPDTASSVFLSVRDDGRGLPDNFRCGFGLLGLTERVRQVRGTLAIRNMHPGVAIDVMIPEEEHQAIAEPEHADPTD